jgi:antirestriction protein
MSDGQHFIVRAYVHSVRNQDVNMIANEYWVMWESSKETGQPGIHQNGHLKSLSGPEMSEGFDFFVTPFGELEAKPRDTFTSNSRALS